MAFLDRVYRAGGGFRDTDRNASITARFVRLVRRISEHLLGSVGPSRFREPSGRCRRGRCIDQGWDRTKDEGREDYTGQRFIHAANNSSCLTSGNQRPVEWRSKGERSASPSCTFGERVERGEYFRRTPHSIAGSVARLDDDSRLGERVEVAVRVGGVDAQLLRQ